MENAWAVSWHDTYVDTGIGMLEEFDMDAQSFPRANDALQAFFKELAQYLDLEGRGDAPLRAEETFVGPVGTICRIHARCVGNGVEAKPEVLLPFDGTEIRHLRADKLLTIQATVNQQLGWFLGSSTEGLLQLSPMEWSTQPREVARDLDMGSSVGEMVVAMLRADAGDADDGPKATH
ncbi:MAG: hypothetical protein JF606_19700 [Burkholderiales bacterium]|jgi:hypothetical protein|nr:hypothetical protein [Burkholderiales bacterium]